MRDGLRFVSWVAVALVGGFIASASGSDLSKFLHDVFNDNHGRPPTGAEVNYYSNLSRTEGPLESLIRMVASNDYYVAKCQQNLSCT